MLGIYAEEKGMSVINDVIQEEYNRLNQLVEFYNQKIAAFPKGSISCRRRRDRIYYYLAYRDHKKVISEYLGKEDSDKYKEVSQMVTQRLRYEKKLKESKESLKQAERLLRAGQ